MKIKKFLGFIALAALIVLPIKANAAGYSIDWGKECVTDASNSDYCTITITGNITDGGSISTPLSATMTLQGLNYISSEGTSNWNVSVSDNQIIMTPSAPETNGTFTIGTIRFQKISEPCKATFTCNEETKTVTPPVKNPGTGKALPYAVIGAGIVIAGVVYYVTRKNTKLYKI